RFICSILKKKTPHPAARFARPPFPFGGGIRKEEHTIDFRLTSDQEAVREAVAKICARFPEDYWRARDRDGVFPHELHKALAADGWLGIAMPEAYGGSGLGISEAALMMQTIAESGAGMSGASAVHMNIFGLNPVIVFGSEEQKRRMLPPLIA